VNVREGLEQDFTLLDKLAGLDGEATELLAVGTALDLSDGSSRGHGSQSGESSDGGEGLHCDDVEWRRRTWK
jgi:hypothetical protein